MRKVISAAALLIMAGMLFLSASGLPWIGDPNSPAATHVSPRYTEGAYKETGSPNIVTAVLADYRGYDTLGETVVIFTAGLATVLILRSESKKSGGSEGGRGMNERFGGIILNTAFRYMVPFTLVYGAYVLFHGEYSPGGGFQAGALFAIGVVLTRLVQGDEAVLNITGNSALILAGFGAFIYGGLGLFSVFLGGNMLEYGVLPFNLTEQELNAIGILGIEIGVTICVMGTIIVIFDALSRREDLL